MIGTAVLKHEKVLIMLTAGVIALHGWMLHLMGRIPWCACGFGIWTGDAWGNDTSQHLADPYSTSHILHGIIFYWVLRRLLPRHSWQALLLMATLVEIGWEILENTPFIINRYRAETASLDYTGDSILNSVGDILFAMLGVGIAYRSSWKFTLALFIFIELVMLALYRDNLTLNILMLLYPLDAIKTWQTGLAR